MVEFRFSAKKSFGKRVCRLVNSPTQGLQFNSGKHPNNGKNVPKAIIDFRDMEREIHKGIWKILRCTLHNFYFCFLVFESTVWKWNFWLELNEKKVLGWRAEETFLTGKHSFSSILASCRVNFNENLWFWYAFQPKVKTVSLSKCLYFQRKSAKRMMSSISCISLLAFLAIWWQ